MLSEISQVQKRQVLHDTAYEESKIAKLVKVESGRVFAGEGVWTGTGQRVQRYTK